MTQEESWLCEEKYGGEKTEGFFADCARLNSGEPLAYIIGHTPFLDTNIFLDSKPLIPRTETEFWVEKIISLMKQKTNTLRVLDLCAGSGCIGVAVLKHVKNARVDFSEIDPSHHPTIAKNICTNNIDESRTKIFGGDLFDDLSGPYDVILTNPPYIDPKINKMEENVKKHEPRIALYGGNDGFEIIERILNISSLFLMPHGLLVIEHDPEQMPKIITQGEKYRFTSIPCKDQYGKFRYTQLTRNM